MKLISFAVLCAQALALFDNVNQLNSNNWAEQVENDKDHVWVVSFYADWCPYCKTFDTEFENAMNDPKLEGKRIKFGAVNVMDSRDLTTRFGIKRSPTVKIFGADRDAPEDYLGHRKQADVVEYCGEYCTTHGFYEPEPVPEVKEAEYIYNIDAIVNNISSAHDQRIWSANEAHQQAIAALNGRLNSDLDVVKQEFEQKLQELIAARGTALQGAKDALDNEIAVAKSTHASNIQNLDAEAIETIKSIIAANSEGSELTDFIPGLMKDWISIQWDQTNRRAKNYQEPQYQAPAPVDPYAQQGGYQDPYAPADPYAQQQQYNPYQQQQEAPKAPEAPAYDPYSQQQQYNPYAQDPYAQQQPEYNPYQQEVPAVPETPSYDPYAQQQQQYNPYAQQEQYGAPQQQYGGHQGYPSYY